MDSSILSGNTTDSSGDFTDQGFNIIGVDARLGPLAGNGGPTSTHALLAGSPAIDAGNAGLEFGVDQRGVARPQGNLPDSGAFELEAPKQSGPNFVVTNTLDNNNSCAIDNCTLRAAIAAANDNTAPSTVSFADNVRGTITLRQGELSISNEVTVVGPGARRLTVSGGDNGRIFRIGNQAVVISDLTLARGDGSPSDGQRQGGAIFSDNGGALTVRRCAFNNNSAEQGGALFVGVSGNAKTVVDACLFQNNVAQFNGGAIYNQALGGATSALTVANSTFTGNFGGGKGAAILTYATGGGNVTTALDSCTFSDNGGSATLYSWNGDNGTTLVQTQVRNSILADNSSFAVEGDASNQSQGHNLFSDGGLAEANAPTDIANANPQLNALANNGGSTTTLALQAGSPAIDAGETELATDARGIAPGNRRIEQRAHRCPARRRDRRA